MKNTITVNEGKNILTVTVGDLIGLYEDEQTRVKDNNANSNGKLSGNALAQYRKCDKMIDLLLNAPEDLVVTVEGCRGDGVIRDFNLCNSGSVVECLIKALYYNRDSVRKAFDETEYDFGAIGKYIEVKASLGSHFLATPSEKELTLLLNEDGFSLIPKAEVLNYCKYSKAKGYRLSNKGLYGYRGRFINKLNELFGFDTE